MNFKLNNEAGVTGGGLSGYFETSYKKLEEKFGRPPEATYFDGKVSTEWRFVSENGDVVTLYDYKETALYSEDRPTMEEFRAFPSYEWHVGSRYYETAVEFIKWLREQIG